MTHTEFIILVKEMRLLQTRYFATKDKTTLFNCKKSEQEVDKFIKDKFNKQTKMF